MPYLKDSYAHKRFGWVEICAAHAHAKASPIAFERNVEAWVINFRSEEAIGERNPIAKSLHIIYTSPYAR